jgi:queuine/archaeosine tRNA-ribosyltransferase
VYLQRCTALAEHNRHQFYYKIYLWVTVCCYCEITTTVNTIMSVFILVDIYRCYIQLSGSDVFTSVSPLILWRRRAALVRSGKVYSREDTDSLKKCSALTASCVQCQPVARGEPGTVLWCRAAWVGRHCGAFRRMRAVDAATRPSGGWCSGADRGGS